MSGYNKADYIIRSLSKIAHKRWENYIINAIVHRLNDFNIEFVCQQPIKKGKNNYYYADIYFPQFQIYLEIDEPHHLAQIDKDIERRYDIENATKFKEYRISVVDKSIDQIDQEVNDFVNLIKSKIEQLETPLIWNYDEKYKPDYHKRRGFIGIGADSAFLKQIDAMACFGFSGKGYQRAAWTIPPKYCHEIGVSENSAVWFPKLNSNNDWENELRYEGESTYIIENNTSVPEYKYIDKWSSRIVFAQSKDVLGRRLYNFVGVFEFDVNYNGAGVRFNRISEKVNTVKL